MIKKLVILGFIFASLLIVSSGTVIAIESEKTLIDDQGDVMSEEGENISRDDIDIKQVYVSQDNRRVTIKTTVAGNIKNKGDIDLYRLLIDEEYYDEYTSGMTEAEIEALFEEMLKNDIASYTFELTTISDEAYMIFYVNNDVLILDINYETVKGSQSVEGDELTITFNLPKSNDNLVDISVLAQESLNLGMSYYEDELYGELFGEENGDQNGNGDDNGSNSDDNSGSGLLLFIAIIAIVVIVGVVVVIFVIRR